MNSGFLAHHAYPYKEGNSRTTVWTLGRNFETTTAGPFLVERAPESNGGLVGAQGLGSHWLEQVWKRHTRRKRVLLSLDETVCREHRRQANDVNIRKQPLLTFFAFFRLTLG